MAIPATIPPNPINSTHPQIDTVQFRSAPLPRCTVGKPQTRR
jgi:hypothetical protein